VYFVSEKNQLYHKNLVPAGNSKLKIHNSKLTTPMKITVICIGKTTDKYLLTGMDEYKKRLRHFVRVDWVELPEVKNQKGLSKIELLDREEALFQKQLKPSDYILLLDEKGKQYTSIGFSNFLKKIMNAGVSNLVFLIGGPYGFSEKLHKQSKSKLSLSKMTFTHQMVRLFFLEQLYRGFTILRNMPYHHE
jgi:23S rRNA (pseudouridine1915-N3)-methyltransferase